MPRSADCELRLLNMNYNFRGEAISCSHKCLGEPDCEGFSTGTNQGSCWRTTGINGLVETSPKSLNAVQLWIKEDNDRESYEHFLCIYHTIEDFSTNPDASPPITSYAKTFTGFHWQETIDEQEANYDGGSPYFLTKDKTLLLQDSIDTGKMYTWNFDGLQWQEGPSS